MPRIAEVALFTPHVARLADFYERLLGRRSAYLRDPDGRAVELQPDT
jgi:catechol 2,3-dioxygenase-like lactoylglutathione lyase family enzyme